MKNNQNAKTSRDGVSAKSLGLMLAESIGNRIRDGHFGKGDRLPSESVLMKDYQVSRTVVREALAKLQAMGLVETRHGIGTFVRGLEDTPFLITADQIGSLHETVALLELRIGIEVEAADLAARRRTAADLKKLAKALLEFEKAVRQGRDAIDSDYAFHHAIASATHNTHFSGLMNTLGSALIPRSRATQTDYTLPEVRAYLERVNAEHRDIYRALELGDADAARTAMRIHLSNSLERRRRAAAKARPRQRRPQ